MIEAITFGLLCFTSLLAIIDPIAVAPVFLAMTDQCNARARRKIALRACGVALAIMLVFAISGGLIFKMFGITISSLRIAGGILFFGNSMQMLRGEEHAHSDESQKPKADPSIVPLGMPLICGPGAISTVMVLMGQATSTLHAALFFAAVIACLAVTALVLIGSPRLVRLIGKTGVEVMTKVVGLIACAIGIQFVIDGVRPIAVEILSAAQ